MPAELGQNQRAKGTVVLVHGLSDSPYTMAPIAERLTKAGYNVLAILLTGHGADQLNNHDRAKVTAEKWKSDVDGSLALAATLFPNSPISLGGFSTGGALALELALRRPTSISHLLLFDPALALPYKSEIGVSDSPLGRTLRSLAGSPSDVVGSNPARIPFDTPTLSPALGQILATYRAQVAKGARVQVPITAFFSSGISDANPNERTIDSDKSKQVLETVGDHAVTFDFSKRANGSLITHSALMTTKNLSHCSLPGNESSEHEVVNSRFDEMSQLVITALGEHTSVDSQGDHKITQ